MSPELQTLALFIALILSATITNVLSSTRFKALEECLDKVLERIPVPAPIVSIAPAAPAAPAAPTAPTAPTAP